MVSGAIAYSELQRQNPRAVRQVLALLQQHPEYEDRWKPLLSAPLLSEADWGLYLFMLAARWPDDAREIHEFDRPTWHYINIPYAPNGDGTNAGTDPDENILTAFQENLTILRSNARPADKAIALCWIFHLVGDVHQPLHTTKLITQQFPPPKGDRGGTRFYIRVRPTTQTISLHQFWDDLILGSQRFQTVRNTATKLRLSPEHQRSALPELAETQFDQWAKQESFVLAQQVVYRNGTLQGSSSRDSGVPLPADYAVTTKPVAQRRVILAGDRLADLLKQIF